MIIGQNKLQNQINTIFDIFVNSEAAIRPHFFLTGSSGSGKTHTIKTLAKIKGCTFLKINAAALTKEGTSGNSISKALTPLLNVNQKPCIIFVDEFDKLFISGNTNNELAHETTNGVQNEFLTLLEDSKASVFGDYGKYIRVNIDNCLFVFAGAFNGQKDINQKDLLSFGLKTEFLGRVGLIYHTERLTLDAFYDILDKSPLLDSYLKLYSRNKSDVIDVLKPVLKSQYEDNILGARLINTLIHQYFIEGKIVTEETAYVEI